MLTRLLALVATLTLALAGAAPAMAQGGPIKIGLLTPLTGAASALGKDMLGGTELYRSALAVATRIELTVIEHHFDGDARMPEFDRERWQLRACERHTDAEWPYRFETWIRA